MKNSNIIISVIFLVIVIIFAFKFEEITGYTSKEVVEPGVFVYKTGDPSIREIKAGEKISVRVKIRDGCVDPKIEFLFNGLHKAYRTFLPTEDDCATQSYRSCKANKYCKGNLKDDIFVLNYKTPSFWGDYPGEYTVRVYYMEKPGQVTHKEPYVEKTFGIIP